MGASIEAVPSEYVAKIRADPFSRQMGIAILEVKRGYAKATMRVRSDMVNFHGVGHGGAIFTLADTAFAAASNSYGRRAVALTMDIAFRHPVFPGEQLVAEAIEASLGKSTALYQIVVRLSDGKLVASCQGMVFRAAKSILEERRRKGKSKGA